MALPRFPCDALEKLPWCPLHGCWAGVFLHVNQPVTRTRWGFSSNRAAGGARGGGALQVADLAPPRDLMSPGPARQSLSGAGPGHVGGGSRVLGRPLAADVGDGDGKAP